MTDVADVLGPGGRLAHARPGFEHRPGQVALAERIAEIIRDGGSLLAEAGTGTGKTLAYLVPAAECPERVVISTATRPLQTQLVDHDLPLLAELLGRPLRVAALKGRRNYLCLQRLETEPAPRDIERAAQHATVRRWAGETASGDRAELASVPEDAPVWERLTVGAESCLGARCPQHAQCFVTRARQAAAQAEIVVVNHHLYFADLALRAEGGAALPDHHTAIFDEAHTVPEIAALFFGRTVSSGRLGRWLTDVTRATARLDPHIEGLVDQVAAAETASRRFFALIRPRDGGRLAWDPTAEQPELERAWLALDDAVDVVAGALVEHAHREEGLGAIVRRASTLRTELTTFFEPAETENAVWFREGRGSQGAALATRPVDPAEVLSTALFDRMRATVFVSATLAPGGDFDYFARRIGAPADVASARFTSPFDYANQARLYVPAAFPTPQSPAFPDAVAEVVRSLTSVTEGRAFVLFTSFRNLRAVHQRLAGLPWPLMQQGEMPRDRLLERFRATPGAVLLGTSSFWEGVDVPGDALSLVIIDKLPFAHVGDPVLQARLNAARERGEQPFRTIQIPAAALSLAQGFGRLIRTATDRGIVAVLDVRLRRQGYGRVLQRALPPAPMVDDLTALAAWWHGDDPGPSSPGCV